MKKRNKLKKIEKEIKEIQKENINIRKKKEKSKVELIFLLIILVAIFIYSVRAQHVNLIYEKFLDFIIFNIVFYIISKEVYLEISEEKDHTTKKYKNIFRIYVILNIVIYILFAIYLFFFRA